MKLQRLVANFIMILRKANNTERVKVLLLHNIYEHHLSIYNHYIKRHMFYALTQTDNEAFI